MTVESKSGLLSTLSIRLPDRLENLLPYTQGVVKVLIPESIFYPHSRETYIKYSNSGAYVVFVSGKFVIVDARGQSLGPITSDKAFLKFYVLKDTNRAFVAVLESLKLSKQDRKEFTLSAPIHNPDLKIAWANPQLAPGVMLYKEK